MPRLKEDLEALNKSGTTYFGYVNIDMFDCPPFVMFTNNEDCPVCSNYLHLKNFERESMKLWCRLVPLATSVIDLGAQGGVYTLAAAAIRGDIPVHAFEPNPDGFARLLMNVVANDFKCVTLHRAAAGHDEVVSEFAWLTKSRGHISSGGRLIVGQTGPEITRVVTYVRPLDKSLEGVELGAHPLLKIDVEGAEQLVLKGMANVLSYKPDIILETFNSESCRVFNEQTGPLGYNCYFIDEDNLRIEQRDRLYACDPKSKNKNQLLSVRPPELIRALA
jgi:FkbM family methyltransferase